MGQSESNVVAHTVSGFEAWFNEHGEGRTAAHILGFNKKMPSDLNEAALESIKDFSVITWGGDAYAEDSFTALVPLFLGKGSDKLAIGFRKKGAVEGFRASWRTVASQFPGRIHVVECDVEQPAEDLFRRLGVRLQDERSSYAEQLPDVRQPYFWFGRLAVALLHSRRIVGVGGGGVAKLECEAALDADPTVQVTVHAQVRRSGKSGRQPGAAHRELVDFAREDGRIEFIPRTDEHYVLSVRYDKNAFFRRNRNAEIVAVLLGEENCFCPNFVKKSQKSECHGRRTGECLGRSVGTSGQAACRDSSRVQQGAEPTDDACWAGSFRWRLEGKCRRGRARGGRLPTMIRLLVDGQMGPGQQQEDRMAREVGNRILEIEVGTDVLQDSLSGLLHLGLEASTAAQYSAVGFTIGAVGSTMGAVAGVGAGVIGAFGAGFNGGLRRRRMELAAKLRAQGVDVPAR
ncbi:unnamed protein product [Prorocentrum cordatum]|uniref:Uncharacterized protein n=1 Tax=Prorocentrum cordatum TaxID=2364126 RepID=A0ABN9TN87_9DINO|nr:unnamed protein product [Polarella glacialis]